MSFGYVTGRDVTQVALHEDSVKSLRFIFFQVSSRNPHRNLYKSPFYFIFPRPFSLGLAASENFLIPCLLAVAFYNNGHT